MTPRRQRVVRAWAILGDYLGPYGLLYWDHSGQPENQMEIYKNKKGALQALGQWKGNGDYRFEIIPCTITYSLPKKGNKR